MPKYTLDTPYRGLGGSIVELDADNPAVLAGYATLYTGPDAAVTPDNHPITDRLIARDIARDAEVTQAIADIPDGGASAADILADADFQTAVGDLVNDVLNYDTLATGVILDPNFSDTLNTAITNATAFTDLQTSVDTSISDINTALEGTATAGQVQTLSDALGSTTTAVNTLVDTTIPALPTTQYVIDTAATTAQGAVDALDVPGTISTALDDYATAHAALQDDTASRPTGALAGTIYFDSDLGMPIWFDGGAWVDATGASV